MISLLSLAIHHSFTSRSNHLFHKFSPPQTPGKYLTHQTTFADFLTACFRIFYSYRISALVLFSMIFSTLHGMPARTSDEKGVCPSVRPSVRRFSSVQFSSVGLSSMCIVTKQKKDLSRFLCHTKDHLA